MSKQLQNCIPIEFGVQSNRSNFMLHNLAKSFKYFNISYSELRRRLFLFIFFLLIYENSFGTAASSTLAINISTTGASSALFCVGDKFTVSATVTNANYCSTGSQPSNSLFKWKYKIGISGATQTGTGASFDILYSDISVTQSCTITFEATVSGGTESSDCSTSVINHNPSSTKTFDWTGDQTLNQGLKFTDYNGSTTTSIYSICKNNPIRIETRGNNWDLAEVEISGDGISTVVKGQWVRQPITPTGTGTVTYNVKGKTTNGCPIEKTEDITVYDLPTISISSNKSPVCKGETIQLTASSSGSNTYSWTSTAGGGLLSTTGSVVSATPTTTGGPNKTYTVEVTNLTTTCKNTQSIGIALIDLPIPTFTTLITLRTATFTNTTPTYSGPGGAIEYVWDFGDGSIPYITSTTLPFSHTYLLAQQYTVTCTIRLVSLVCASPPTPMTITIDATPIPNFSMPLASCLKDDGGGSGSYNTVNFTNTTTSNPSGKEGTFSYIWDFGDGFTKNATFGASITHEYHTDGIFTVKLTATNSTGRETIFITKNISIDPNPFISQFTVTGNCQASSIDFQDQTHQYHILPEKVEWDFDGNSSIDATYTSSNVPPTPAYKHYFWTFNSANTYTSLLKLTYTTTGCISTITKSVTIDAKPTPSITLSNTEMCENTATPISFSTNSYSEYSWVYTPVSNTLRYSTLQSSNITTPWIEVGNNQKLALKVKSSQNCWSDEVSSLIDIWQAPVSSFTNTTVCDINDNLTQFSNTSTGPGTLSYFWDLGNGGSTSTTTSPSFDYPAGSYNVKLTTTESNHNCFADVTNSVTVKPNPNVDFTISSTRCEGQAIDFTDISSLAGNTIASRLWDWNNDGTYDLTTTNVISQNTYSSAGNYSIKLKATASNSCYDTKVSSITIYPKPNVPTITIPTNSNNNTNLICAGESYTLNANPSSGFSYSWFFNGNDMGNGYYSSSISDVGNLPLPDARPYAVRITNGNGCYNTSATTTVGIKRLNTSIIISNGNNILCKGATATLSGSALTMTQTYQWKKDPYNSLTQTFSGTYSNVGTNSQTHLVDDANEGRYKYLATYHIAGSFNDCSDESSTIDIIDAPPLTLNYTGVVNINVNAPQSLSFVYNPYPTYTSFKWYRNGLLESTAAGFLVTKPGKYYLVALGSCGFEKSNLVEFKYDCNAVGYYGGYTGSQTFTTTTTITGLPTIKINGDWTISAAATLNLTNLNIVVSNCSKIIVTSGTLNINGCTITGCTQWNGLISSSTSSTININSSSISGAVVGVASESGGIINANQSQFDNNNLHIGFGSSLTTNTSTISFCDFGDLNLSSAGCTHPDYPGYSYVNHPLLYLENAKGVSLINNKLNCFNTNSTNKIEGIQAKNCELMDISYNYDEGFLDRGINIRQGNLMTLTNNTFGFSLSAPLNLYTSRLGWFKTGLLLTDAKGSDVERNLITNADEGISFYQNTLVPVTNSNIAKNRMENCNWGLVTATKENPVLSSYPYQNSSTQNLYVTVNCNSFNYNLCGWVGTGKYNNQGSLGLATGNSYINNNQWNVCVADNGHTYFNNSSASDDCYSASNPNIIMDGNTYTSTNYTTLCLSQTTGGPNTCNGNKRSSHASSSVSNIDISNKIVVSSFPNPFDNNLQLKFNGLQLQSTFNIKVFDVTGKLMVEKVANLNENEVFNIDSEMWVDGLYVLQVMRDNEVIYTQKLIKVNN